MTALALLPLPLILLGILFILRFWHALDLLGFRDEVLHRDTSLFAADLLTVSIGGAVIVGISYGLATSASPFFLCAVSVAGLMAFAHLYGRTGHATTLAASRIEAIRTVAALRLITAAELAHALRRLGEYEGGSPSRDQVEAPWTVGHGPEDER